MMRFNWGLHDAADVFNLKVRKRVKRERVIGRALRMLGSALILSSLEIVRLRPAVIWERVRAGLKACVIRAAHSPQKRKKIRLSAR